MSGKMGLYFITWMYLTVLAGHMATGALTGSGNTDISAQAWYETTEEIIPVTGGQIQENISGYSLIRTSGGHICYLRDMPYLLDEAVVGKGVFVSEYMGETEIFLGEILRKVLEERGKADGKGREYFTDWALKQVGETDWDLLGEEWEADPYAYDRYYRLNDVFGETGYDFYYFFYADREKTTAGETETVSVRLSVNGSGQIYQIQIKIETVPLEKAGMEIFVNETGLFDDVYGEYVILNGQAVRERMVWDFEKFWRRFMYPDETYEQCNRGLLASGNVSASAEGLGDILIDLLENGMEDANVEELFGSVEDFTDFADSLKYWRDQGGNWTAADNYDCFFRDNIYSAGNVGFRYIFYPDYGAMEVDAAETVIIECCVGVSGELSYADMKVFPMTREEYQKAAGKREKEGEGKTRVVEGGTVLRGKAKAAVPVPDRQLQPVPVSRVEIPAVPDSGYVGKKKTGIWGFTDAGEAADFLGKKFLEDIHGGNMQAGEISALCVDKDRVQGFFSRAEKRFPDNVWDADDRYDCYHIGQNEVAECIHLQYYFYPQRTGRDQESGRVMVVDVYLSEQGIVNMNLNDFRKEFQPAE